MKTFTKETLSRICILVCSLFFLSNLQAQVEFKANPLPILNQHPVLAVEFLVHDKIGLEAACMFPMGESIEYDYENLSTNVLNLSGYNIKLSGRYYLNPKNAGAQFYAGAFAQSNLTNYEGNLEFFVDNPNYRQTSLEFGSEVGYKWLFWNHLVIDINFGGGAMVAEEKDFVDLNKNDEVNDLSWTWGGGITVGYRINKKKQVEVLHTAN